MHTARTARIRRDWEHLTRHGGSILLDALAGIPLGLPPLPTLLRANLISSESLTLEQDRAYSQALAEVYSVPDPARILLDDVVDRLRPALARMFAHRHEHEHPSPADYAVADLQLLISEEWAHTLQRHRFRRASADVIRDITGRMDVRHRPNASHWAHAEPIDLGAEIRDYIGYRQPRYEGWTRQPDRSQPYSQTAHNRPQTAAKSGRTAKMGLTLRRGRTAILAAMLMVDEDAIAGLLFGSNMVRGRHLAGDMTQQQLAERLCDMGLAVDQRNISRWERGKREPRKKTRKLIADALGQPLDFFYDTTVLRDQP